MIFNWRQKFRKLGQNLSFGGGLVHKLFGGGLEPGGELHLSQIAVEDLETTDDQLVLMSQIAVEDLEQLNGRVRLTQICMELLIPFDCDLTPIPGGPTQPGCPTEPIVDTPSDDACVDTLPTGDSTADDGCEIDL